MRVAGKRVWATAGRETGQSGAGAGRMARSRRPDHRLPGEAASVGASRSLDARRLPDSPPRLERSVYRFLPREHRPTGHTVLLQFPSGVVPWDRTVGRSIAAWPTCGMRTSSAVIRLWSGRSGVFSYSRKWPDNRFVERFNVAGRLPVEQVCRLAVSVARGLAAIHRSGRPHGDVRPENILCSVAAQPAW